jgi:hypothetical protein
VSVPAVAGAAVFYATTTTFADATTPPPFDPLLGPDELQQVQTQISSGHTQSYRPLYPAKLLMTYWTAEARADGTLRYYPDIYERDQHLIDALARADNP